MLPTCFKFSTRSMCLNLLPYSLSGLYMVPATLHFLCSVTFLVRVPVR